ncbi:MAG: 3-deoxy-8-phosphooctulonate synthase [Calditrichia bacterium]
MKEISIDNIIIGLNQPLTVIAGPCVIENEEMILYTAEHLVRVCQDLPVQLIFKTSLRKANRTSLSGFTGIHYEKALQILGNVRKKFTLPVLTDVHSELEVPVVAEIADILQIPAFLCRQTDLLMAAGRSGKAVNIKKGQFLYPGDMEKAAEKVASTGNERILLTERGSSFGYHNLVVDMRSPVIMSQTNYPVVYDATHSVQLPGGEGDQSGGQPEFILPLARAAIATGAVSAVFMEVHPDPAKAMSDAKSQLRLNDFKNVLSEMIAVYSTVREMRKEI